MVEILPYHTLKPRDDHNLGVLIPNTLLSSYSEKKYIQNFYKYLTAYSFCGYEFRGHISKCRPTCIVLVLLVKQVTFIENNMLSM